jgi:hypothetical protein
LWTSIGSSPPAKGQESVNAKLSFALKRRTDFTLQDLESYQLGAVRPDHFIKSGSPYFQPSASNTGWCVKVGGRDHHRPRYWVRYGDHEWVCPIRAA